MKKQWLVVSAWRLEERTPFILSDERSNASTAPVLSEEHSDEPKEP